MKLFLKSIGMHDISIYLTKFPTHLVRFLPIFQKRIDQKYSNSKYDKIHHFEIMW